MKITDEQLDHFEEDTDAMISMLVTWAARWAWIMKVPETDITPIHKTRLDGLVERVAASLEKIQ